MTGFGFLETCGPTDRTFSPGEYPVRRFTSISGAGTSRLYGSKQSNAELQLTFVLSDSDTSVMLKAWDDAKGTFDTLNLPPQFFAGVGDLLASGIPEYLNWRWAEKPSVTSLLPGRSRVQIRLVATLDNE